MLKVKVCQHAQKQTEPTCKEIQAVKNRKSDDPQVCVRVYQSEGQQGGKDG